MKAKCKLLMLFSWLIASIHCLARALSWLFTAVNCFAHKQIELRESFVRRCSKTLLLLFFALFLFILKCKTEFCPVPQSWGSFPAQQSWLMCGFTFSHVGLLNRRKQSSR